MSANKHLAHILVIPEDDANRQLANGFCLGLSIRQVQVLPVAGGWKHVLELFKSDHIGGMNQYPQRYMVLLIDFDGRPDRLETAKSYIPTHLLERVIVLGVWTEPETLKEPGQTYESIGQSLARECRDGQNETWSHDLLRHNEGEIERLNAQIRPILFPPD